MVMDENHFPLRGNILSHFTKGLKDLFMLRKKVDQNRPHHFFFVEGDATEKKYRIFQEL